MTWLPTLLTGYTAVVALYVAVRLTAIWVRGRLADRKFARYLVALQAEADALLCEATLRRFVGEP